MLTPKSNAQTRLTKRSFTREELNHLLRLLNFMNCSMFSCSHFFQTESRVSRLRELRKIRLKKVRQWRLRKTRVIQTARRIKNWIRVMFHQAGNWRETATKTQQHIPKSGKMTLNLPAQETGTEWWICKLSQHQETGASWRHPNRKVKDGNPQYADFRPSIPWESPQEPAENFNLAEEAPMIDIEAVKTNVLIWGLFMSTTIEAAVHFGPSRTEKWKYTGKQTSKSSRICSKSRRDWHWNMKPNFWRYHRLIGQLPHGRDLHLRTTKWSRGRKHKYTSTQIPPCAWGKCQSIQKRF